ncbi:MAG: hypothetical protein A2901_00135 [Elusimicrobia bacterium RIFCSPLOWO2_01_FULL_54_10]|nr:MAG: hypothetical protein A2901_00135 [Elusimicrobia bacterium RIFCSPLOWO2_01_FULL_54_10]
MKSINRAALLRRARTVLAIESQAVRDQMRHLDIGFSKAVETLHRITLTGGQVVVMGIGKSGLVGRKIASTLSSTGTPAIFFHPSEGLHGDLGMIRSGDAVLALSQSGESDEIKKILPTLKDLRLPLVAMTQSRASRLARLADIVILTAVRKEACPLNLAPTASTTAMLALGDALAMALMEINGFNSKDFARLHPGGAIGKKLTLKVSDLMRSGRANPVVRLGASVRSALLEMTRARLGATSVVNSSGRLAGFFTDGDLRRRLQKEPRLLEKKIDSVMTKNPTRITPDKSIHEALNLLKDGGFDNIPVVDSKGRAVGILDERDLLAEGIA